VPELPEVETVRKRLEPLVRGRTIVRADVLDPRLVDPATPAHVSARLAGARIGRLERRGKYLVVRLDDDAAVLVHLRMTGNVLHLSGQEAPPYVRATLHLDDGARVVFSDVRRFGTWLVLEADEVAPYLDERLGPEPFDAGFGAATLRRAFARRRAPVKALLLDQRLIAGVGNIYADEALYRARIHPTTPAGEVSRSALARLAAAVRDVLLVGIESQGASIRDYRTPAGGYGSMQERFQVFERDGEACLRCGTRIVKLVVAGRGTHVCPRCQRPPRAVPR